MKIPEIRDLLIEIADDTGLEELRQLAEELS